MRDRFPLAVLAALLFAAAAGVLLFKAGRRGGFAEPLSTYRSASDGARALFLLAQQAGLPVQRRHYDLRQLEDGVGTVVLFGDVSLSEPESERLTKFVSEGGRVVLVLGPPPAAEKQLFGALLKGQKPVADVFALEWTASDDAELERDLEVTVASPLTRGAVDLRGRVAGYVARADAPRRLTLVGDPREGGRAVASAFAWGEGWVIALSAPDLASNRALGVADNARFWLSLLGALAEAGTIQFDEYHHGFTGERSIASWAAGHGLHWALAQALLAIWVWVAALRRFGRARPASEDERRGSADYLVAMARIYRQGGHRAHAARLLVDGLTRALARRAALPGRPSVEATAAALAGRGRRDLARALASVSSSAEPGSDEALLALARRCASTRRLADAGEAGRGRGAGSKRGLSIRRLLRGATGAERSTK